MYLVCSAIIACLIACLLFAAQAQQAVYLSLGSIEFVPSINGVVIAAPHGRYDKNTDLVAISVAKMLGSGYIIARGFVENNVRINVNRPTELCRGFQGCECMSTRAAEVYSRYMQILQGLRDRERFSLYVEIHGNDALGRDNVIEIANVGLSSVGAVKIKGVFKSQLAVLKRRHPDYPDIDLKMEPVDHLFYRASQAKRIGSLSANIFDKALHVELPVSVRQEDTIRPTAELLSALIQRFDEQSGKGAN